jgi:lipid-binding SYLF domain-containing protein
MKKLLSMFATAALVGAVAPALADDTAADAKKAGEEAVVAGEKAEKAGEKAERAGDEAQRSKDARHVKYGKHDQREVQHAARAIGELQRADPGLTQLFDDSAGYAVFATVGKGGLGLGGAHGSGVLYERGTAIGNTTLTQVTVGLQIGGQAYTEVIFFETEKSLSSFKKGNFAMAAQVSAVAVKSGASANAKYVEGVSVFTLAKGGAMAEASVGGQKFGYSPFRNAIITSSR